MIQKKHLVLLVLLFAMVALALMTGCSTLPFARPTATVTSSPTATPPKPTLTPTHTPTSTSTSTPTITLTPTITSTPTLPPPLDDFSQARLYSSGPRPGWDFAITILLPEPIKGEYIARIGDPQKTYECKSMPEYDHPERLYCSGRQPGVDKNVDFFILEKFTGQEVFKGSVYLPLPN